MYDIASSTAQISATAANLGVAIALVIGIVLGSWAALVGLGYFIRKAQSKVTGKKF
jgi:ABC-type dipeptide/oligopeptide/nickel transport system permease subunit